MLHPIRRLLALDLAPLEVALWMAAVLALCPAAARAASCAQTGDPVPGEMAVLESFSPPVVDGGLLAFTGVDAFGEAGVGVAPLHNEVLDCTFKFFRPSPAAEPPPQLLGPGIAFTEGSLALEAETSTGVPAIGVVPDWQSPELSYAVRAGDPIPATPEVYFKITLVNATVTNQPGGDPLVGVVFAGEGASRRGIYASDDISGIKALVDNTTVAPDGAGLFTDFGDADAAGSQLVFVGDTELGVSGIARIPDTQEPKSGIEWVTNSESEVLPSIPVYTKIEAAHQGGALAPLKLGFTGQKAGGGEGLYAIPDATGSKFFPLADTDTELPGAPGFKFAAFEDLALSPDGWNVAFVATGTDGSRAIYTVPFEQGAIAQKVVSDGDTILGKKAARVEISDQALGSLGYLVEFGDQTQAVVFVPDFAVPALPHPALLLLGALALMTIVWSARRA